MKKLLVLLVVLVMFLNCGFTLPPFQDWGKYRVMIFIYPTDEGRMERIEEREEVQILQYEKIFRNYKGEFLWGYYRTQLYLIVILRK